MGSGNPGRRYEEFVREYGESAFHCAYRLCGDVEEAKDVVQESFCRVLSKWEHYDESQSLEGWFFAVLKNVFLDGRKRYDRRRVSSLDEPVSADADIRLGDVLPGDDKAFLDELERAEAAERVQSALGKLTFEHREILALCDMQGLTYEEVGKVLDVPAGTVRSRISRARAAFRRICVTPEVGVYREEARK